MNVSGPSLCCVILTQGGRDEELRRAAHSVSTQRGPAIDLVVVGNGARPVPPIESSRVVALSSNLGIPGGRNVGVVETTADVILFVDDDGWLVDDGLADHLRRLFAREPRLGVVSFRVVEPVTCTTARRHVPRIRVGDPRASSEVTTFLGGACAIRRQVLDDVGHLPARFFYAHEETDLAWRAIDAGWRIRYDADAVMCHPATLPTRHELYLRLNARNRVWLVRRRLPASLAVAHLAIWIVLTVLRLRDPRSLRVWFAGLAEGLRTPCGERRPIGWRTAVRMTRLGRPPII